MVADFKRRFWVCMVLTLPVLLLSPAVQGLLGLEQTLSFPGDAFVLWVLATVVYLYGGYPFLKGLRGELMKARPGMMTLIGVAITTAYLYSSAVVFGLRGKVFFWELVTLIDVMLLGHWMEMRSVMGASRALEELVKLMPSDAHKLTPEGGDGRCARSGAPGGGPCGGQARGTGPRRWGGGLGGQLGGSVAPDRGVEAGGDGARR